MSDLLLLRELMNYENWDYIMCFDSDVCLFFHTYKPGVIKTLTDTEFFPATLEQENNDWSFIISVLVQRHFFIKLILIAFEIIIHLWQRISILMTSKTVTN